MGSMDRRTLPHTTLEVSRVCFGAMTFGSQTDEAAATRMVDLAIDRGVNFFDTSNNYSDGRSETILGKALGPRRSQVVLASKLRNPVGDGSTYSGLSRAAMLQAIDHTLLRLNTDYLDVYYLHAPDWNVPIEETLGAMDEIVRSGKVRYPASSNYAGWQVAQMICIAQRERYQPPYVSQPMYNLLARGIEQEYLPMCQAFGVSTVVYNPLAGGMLTGKQHPGRPLPGTRFDNNQMYLDRYWHPAFFHAIDRLQEVARHAGRSLIDLSLSWLLHHTPVDCALLGASKPEQLEQNLDAVEHGAPLPPEALTAIDEIWRELRGVTPKYNR